MKKKSFFIFICIVIIITLLFTFVSCENSKKTEQKTIVFLGDSIAEGLLGASPISERENYAYYALVGKMNGYKYYNRSVSGHTTAQSLAYIKREEDFGAQQTRSLLLKADIIDISIIGNDLLQFNTGKLVCGVANEYNNGNHGKSIILSPDGVPYDNEYRDSLLDNAEQNIRELVRELKVLNPSATILMRTVYNPVFEETKLVSGYYRESLTNAGWSVSEFRELGALLISSMNDVVENIVTDNKNNNVHLIDIYSGFDDVANSDSAIGEQLIYPDDTHPSNFGHAIMASATQRVLENLGLAVNSETSIKEYKALKVAQLVNLYSDTKVDVSKTRENILKAKTLDEVSLAYFQGTLDIIPIVRR